jgi:hypothetical protein
LKPLPALRVTNSTDTYFFSQPRFHPSGKRIVATKWSFGDVSIPAAEAWVYDVPPLPTFLGEFSLISWSGPLCYNHAFFCSEVNDEEVDDETYLDRLSSQPAPETQDYSGTPLLLRTLPRGYQTPEDYALQQLGPEMMLWTPDGQGVVYSKNVADEAAMRIDERKGMLSLLAQ